MFSGSAGLFVASALLCAGESLPGKAFADSAKPTSPKAPSARVERIEKIYAENILGRPVRDEKGVTIGHIVDVLIDTLGDPQAAIVEFEGFLGVGNRRVAVAWSALRFSVKGDRMMIGVALDPAQLRVMPEYKPSAKSVPVAVPAQPARVDPPESH